ncbi:DUF4406 domain-containing protein [Tessaracoccus sp.]
MNTRLYVAGPTAGLPGLNYPAFRQATLLLLLCGYEVEDPTTNGEHGEDHATQLRPGLSQLLKCDGVAILPGWETSREALLEITVAQALQLPIRGVGAWRELVSGVSGSS